MTQRNTEQWRPVPGFPLYEVSSRGRFRAIPRLDSKGRKQGDRRKILKQARNVARGGYWQIGLVPAAGKQAITKRVNRLVLLAFVGPPPEGKPHACHRNDDKDDNRLENLYWGSPAENAVEKVRNGKHHYARRTHCAEGHPLSGDNLIESTETLKSGSKIKRRRCRACKNRQARERNRT